MVWKRIQAERQRGRDYQPRFQQRHVIGAWIGALLAITALGLISLWSHYPLVVAPFGASTVLLFGHPSSPLAQPRNVVLGNTVAAVVSVSCVMAFGDGPWVMGLAVAVTITLGQVLRCLHPPAGAVALLGVLLKAQPGFIWMPVLSGSLVMMVIAVAYSRLQPGAEHYPHHWL